MQIPRGAIPFPPLFDSCQLFCGHKSRKTIDKQCLALFNNRDRRLICGVGLWELTIAHEKGKPVVRRGRKAVILGNAAMAGHQECLAAEGDRKNGAGIDLLSDCQRSSS